MGKKIGFFESLLISDRSIKRKYAREAAEARRWDRYERKVAATRAAERAARAKKIPNPEPKPKMNCCFCF